ncbi:peptidoglycan/xylan/chitin deacetylase (PgdA/CDA1 family) [Actinoplanes lutulentus]|uniref:polysaccharide deacetylase family protein n=1 Tax=Actinoplanes lutulentus TaxID=1287878 RepID=UPI0017C725E2|nr:polysaccharide deacetylase family protein [Actinoplanes lutulentus]MBB2947100.1 peptidoglycan/xylan/chitin deacetylase (PgdA/CDA1 family) [Actinoplanes lutulentus]
MLIDRRRAIAISAVLVLAGCGAPSPAPAPVSTPAQPVASASAASASLPASTLPPSTAAPIVESAPAVVPGAVPAGQLPAVVNHGPRSAKKVALTFDADMTDAMKARLRSGEVTSYANRTMLKTLEKQKIPATFFVTGQWAEVYPELTRRIADNPLFEIANHTYEHAAFTGDCYGLPRLPAGAMTEDVAKTFRTLEPFGGRQTRYMRFPGLCHDQAALRALAPLGLTVIDGDVVSGDPFARSAKPVVNAVLSQVKPGSIIIMHVTEANAEFSDDALPVILAGLKKRGLEPVTLSELLN